MIRLPAAGPVLRGIDVYHGDAMPTVVGTDFCFLKASESETYEDPTFHARWAQLKSAKIARGAYHFYRPGGAVLTEVQSFVRCMGQLDAGDLPPTLDVETLNGETTGQVRLEVMEALRYIRAQTGRHALIYGSSSFLEDLALPAGLPNRLWVANYGVSSPHLPAPWAFWDFWQYSEDGIDRNYFNGDLMSLARLIDASKAD